MNKIRAGWALDGGNQGGRLNDKAEGFEIMPNAILVPQRAVQQLLDKSFVIVVDENNKSESRAVKLGEKVGSFWIIKEGISANDTVVVEGLTKLQAGVDLDVTMVTPEDLSLSMNS